MDGKGEALGRSEFDQLQSGDDKFLACKLAGGGRCTGHLFLWGGEGSLDQLEVPCRGWKCNERVWLERIGPV